MEVDGPSPYSRLVWRPRISRRFSGGGWGGMVREGCGRDWVWDGLIDQRNSLGILSCSMVAALRHCVNVRVSPWRESDPRVVFKLSGELFWANRGQPCAAQDVWVRLCDPFSAHCGQGTRVPYVYHESSWLPDSVVKQLNEATAGMCVMSEFQREIMLRNGYVHPLAVVLNGVDGGLFVSKEHKSDADEGRPYVFVTLGKLSRRKGSDIIIDAFQTAFSKGQNVRLILQTPSGVLEGRERITDSRISVVERQLSRLEVAALLRSADCYVSATRSDASHMPGLEALASGLVLIAPQFSGMNDYLRVAESKIALEAWHKVPADGPGEWLEPETEEVATAMKAACDLRLDGSANSRIVRDQFSWERSAQSMVGAISAIVGL